MKRILLILSLVCFFGTVTPVWASGMYQRCQPSTDCVIGEFVFDNDGAPISSNICTIDIRNPSGTLVVDDGAMTPNADGWHYYTSNIASPEGLYRSLMYCDNSGDTGYVDKTFVLGTSFDNVDTKVWANSTRTLSTFGTLVADVTTAVWEAATSGLTTVGSIGKRLADNINATISSRSSHTAADVDTQLSGTHGAGSWEGTTAVSVADAVWDEARADHTTGGTFGQGVASVQGSVVGSVASVTGAVGSVTGNIGGNLQGNVVGTVASVTGAVGSISDVSNIDTQLSGTHGVGSWEGSTASNIADAVWDESTTGHTTAGTFGQQLATDVDAILVDTGTSLPGQIDTQTTSIKGSGDKDLTDLSGEVAAVQTTVDSIESKVDSLASQVTTIDTNLDTVLAKWGSSSVADIIGYVDSVETSLGDSADVCATDATVFGHLACVKDKWGSQTGDTLYTAANGAYTTAVSIRSELAYNGKSTTAYEDLQSLVGYVDTLETLIGGSSDVASTATLFGRIKKVQDEVDQLAVIDTNIDTLISKWGSYSASSLYEKVKNLSSDISGINALSNISSILSLSQTAETDAKEIKNKVLSMQAVVGVNRRLLEQITNQPIIETWLEEGSVIFKTLITNPSSLVSQEVPLKYYLPREVKKEDIIALDESLRIDYDPAESAYYVHGEFTLLPKDTKTVSVEVTDIWQISEEEVASLRQRADDLFKPLEGTSYFAQGSTFRADIDVSLNKIQQAQKEAYTPESRIKVYREGVIELAGVEVKLERMQDLVTGAGSMGSSLGFVGGVQTVAVWGLVLVLVAGFVFLALYFRSLIVPGIPTPRQKLPKAKNRRLKVTSGKFLAIFCLVAFSAGASLVWVMANRAKTSSPDKLDQAREPLGDSVGTGEAEPKPQEVKVTEEKQVLGGRSVRVVVAEGEAVNIRREPSLKAEVVTMIWVSRVFTEVSREGDWVQIDLGIDEDAGSAGFGWVKADFVENR